MSATRSVFRNSWSTTVAIALTGFLLHGCASGGRHVVEMKALLATDRAWVVAAQSDDIDRLIDFWTDDAVIYAQGRPPVVGKSAIREMVTKARQIPGYSMKWKTTKAVVGKAGDIAYTLGSHRVTLPDRSGTLVPMAGHFICTWRKENDKWRCDTECWNASPLESR